MMRNESIIGPSLSSNSLHLITGILFYSSIHRPHRPPFPQPIRAAMGIAGLWQYIKELGYMPNFVQIDPNNPAQANRTFLVDLLGSCYAVLRRACKSHDLDTAHRIVESHLNSCGYPKLKTLIFIDGTSPGEKSDTQRERKKKRVKALTEANSLYAKMVGMFKNDQKLRTQPRGARSGGINGRG